MEFSGLRPVLMEYKFSEFTCFFVMNEKAKVAVI